jgi:predicted dienelactone hydrolase
MNTKYTQRATIAVPHSQIEDANQLALCLGESYSDDRTFSHANYQDAEGNIYAVCSTVAKSIFSEMAVKQLQAPTHALNVNLEKAHRAQTLLQINKGMANPNIIAVVLGDRLEKAQEHIQLLGLSAVLIEE